MTSGPPPPSLLDGASLFLDFDGTLVDFVSRPDAISVDPALRGLLANLQERFAGRVAVISGRGLDDISGLLDIDGLALAGSHGLEYRMSGATTVRTDPPEAMQTIFAEAKAFAGANGLLAELKPAAVALHYRNRPERSRAALEFAGALAARHELLVQKGAMVVEMRARGADKGTILRHFMAEPPFTIGRPVFVGDDFTDEDAFRAADNLGGTGILVGKLRSSAAKYRLANVSAVRSWLSWSNA